MRFVRFLLLPVLYGVVLAVAGCADRQAAGPTVILHENGVVRRIPAARFDEASYLKRGYIKNTDGQGNVIYVYVPKQDYQEQNSFRGMDILDPTNYRDPTDRGGGGLNPGMGAGDDWR